MPVNGWLLKILALFSNLLRFLRRHLWRGRLCHNKYGTLYSLQDMKFTGRYEKKSKHINSSCKSDMKNGQCIWAALVLWRASCGEPETVAMEPLTEGPNRRPRSIPLVTLLSSLQDPGFKVGLRLAQANKDYLWSCILHQMVELDQNLRADRRAGGSTTRSAYRSHGWEDRSRWCISEYVWWS